MICNRSKKWISDLIDGRLGETQKTALEKHLSECLSCRAYKDHLEEIRAGARGMEKVKISPRHREDFAVRLKEQLRTVAEEKKKTVPLNWRWIYGTVAAALAVFLVLKFFVFQPRYAGPDELYAYSIGGSLSEIYSDISSNLELEDLFNSLVLASIDEALAELGWSEEAFILQNPLDRYPVTEGEMSRPDSKNKEDIKI